MPLFLSPSSLVFTTAASYAGVLALTQVLDVPSADLPANVKAISSLHATITTGLSLFALSKPWPVKYPLPPLNLGLGKSPFNDSTNPMIVGKNDLGNAITGLETGYILFDTLALLYVSSTAFQNARNTRNLTTSISRLARKDALTLTHHLSLLIGLGILQHFISKNRERGVYIIVSLILMNASTPLLHLRWWRRKVTGKGSLGLDVPLAIVFGTCRVGVVWWVLRQYGRFHGEGAWGAMRGQRWICQAGTGALVGVNGLWLAALMRSIGKRLLSRGASRPPRGH